MGLDLYAGTPVLCPQLENRRAAMAEENGYSFSRVTPDGEAVSTEEEMTPAEIQEGMEDWRDHILAAVSPEGETAYCGEDWSRHLDTLIARLEQERRTACV